jgi:hypothetical protein
MQNYIMNAAPFSEYIEIAKRWGLEEEIIEKIVIKNRDLLSFWLREAEKFKQKYPMKSLFPKFLRDVRTDEEYIRDIVEGWLIEDLIFVWLQHKISKLDSKASIEMSGTDKSRKIIFGTQKGITTKPDIKVTFSNGKVVYIEFQSARKKLYAFDMKKDKVENILKKDRPKFIFLWWDKVRNKYFILKPTELITKVKPTPNPLWGGKETYRVKISQIRLRDMVVPLSAEDFS